MRVRKLEWGNHRLCENGLKLWFSAELRGSYFRVYEARPQYFKASYELLGDEPYDSLGGYATEIEAKQACQAFWDEFILEQLCE